MNYTNILISSRPRSSK